MSKVYLVMKEDFEGTNDQLVEIFSSEELARTYIKIMFPEEKRGYEENYFVEEKEVIGSTVKEVKE